jgi:hypothetical protein
MVGELAPSEPVDGGSIRRRGGGTGSYGRRAFLQRLALDGTSTTLARLSHSIADVRILAACSFRTRILIAALSPANRGYSGYARHFCGIRAAIILHAIYNLVGVLFLVLQLVSKA